MLEAYREEEGDKANIQSEQLKVGYWIGSILSDFGTGFFNAFAKKPMEKTLGQIHAKTYWDLSKPEDDPKFKYGVEDWEFDMFKPDPISSKESQ